MILRDDDINPNTNFYQLYYHYQILFEFFPSAEIWACITLFARDNAKGSVYEEVPFKHRPVNWFYDVNRFLHQFYVHPKVKVCSHGLFHADHSKLSREAQEMSILSSCQFLSTKTFVPPFNRFNEDTIEICEENGIELIKKDGWLSFEHEPFDPSHPKWYFHSWRWDVKSLQDILSIPQMKNRLPQTEDNVISSSK